MDNSNLDSVLERIAVRVVNDLIEGLIITDRDMNIIMVNPAFTRITGYESHEVMGKNPNLLSSGRHDSLFYRSMWDSIVHKGCWRGEIWNRDKNGKIYLQYITITAMLDTDGNVMNYVAVLIDITESRRVEEKLKKEIWLARQVQRVMLSEPIENKYIRINGIYRPSEDLGGDMYCWYRIDEHRYGVIIIDVAGHGVSASLVSSSIRSLLRGMIVRLQTPTLVMQELNEQMFRLFKEKEPEGLYSGFYFTAIYLLIDTNRQMVWYANAGHTPGRAINDEGEVYILDQGCVPIGMVPDIQVEEGLFSYTSSTKIVLFTDGFVEKPGTFLSESLADLDERMKRHYFLDNQLFVECLLNEQVAQIELEDDISLVSVQLFSA
ncbi:sigma-B regulation protein RsbU (phosphoserine phosphatase) [Aneurinibacillus soli]|uniref:Phosphoserine phosphatase RsbP n=1 Tax=Aneurinibacillus soli TaxID=1500254 RepID=A0A0U5BGT6_9BACL|nr:SpoIIE family protein phosphatase [Aneurinibacillus soli]PYE58039.1 sigma-B regulation protein RsbU (phosphoserine phosphatase) [Aneurinibacillus soli]BAU29917.1 Phosphoserine phosphatase RsbP [Aneurinibacillus soli]